MNCAHGSVMAVLAGKLTARWSAGAPLAGKKAPAPTTLDLDATGDPMHGHQDGRFFHGYYSCYCNLLVYVFCGRPAPD